MNRHAIALGKIYGIDIDLDYTWFLIFGLLTWSLAMSYFPMEFPNWSTTLYWFIGGATSIMLFVSVLLHELGHSVVAMRYGIPVRRITLFIFGGVAQIGAEPPSAGSEFWIAIAGPVVSFALVAVFAVLESLVQGLAPLFAMAKYLAFINGLLAAFNLIPGFPLDGGRVFRAIVWAVTRNFRKATLVAANVGRLIAFLFIFIGVWQVFAGNISGGIWIAIIGWFLESAATSQVQQQLLHGVLAGHKVSEAMSRGCTAVPPDATVQDVVDHYVLAQGQRSFVVKADDMVQGLLTIHNVKSIPRERWPEVRVQQAMTSREEIRKVRPDADLTEALQQMDRDGVNQMPVMTNGHMVGMLNRDDVINYLRVLQDLAPR
jgi:Zn-dependent protease